MFILGIDPGFASFGWSIVEVTSDAEQLHDLGVIRTSKANKKLNVLATDDNVRRTRKLHRELVQIYDEVVESGVQINLIATESQSWPRNASATAKVGMAWGVVSSFAEERGLGIVQATPTQIKLAVTGDKQATKAGVRASLSERAGYEDLEEHLSKIRATTKHEHPVDACGAVIACLRHPSVQMGRSM